MRRWLDQRLERRRGFTIVELLIVIAVIGVLAAIVVVGYGAVVNNAHDSSVKSDLQKIDDAFKLFALDSGGTFPDSYSELGGLGIKIAADSYDTATKANMYICVNAGATEYAVIAMSRSQKRFVVKSESGISEYTGGVVWSNVDAMHEETCESIDPAYQSANGITGFTDGAWLSWTGAEGAVASIICPSGFIVVPGSATFGTDDFCVMKYEAKNVSGVATSQASGSPWVSISQTNAISTATAACTGCHLITEAEWLTIAHNVLNVASNWSGGSVGSGYIYSGHNDNSPANSLVADSNDNNGYSGTGQSATSSQRRTLTLSNSEVIWDTAGNVWEWTSGTTSGAGNQPGAPSGGTYAWREWNTSGLLVGSFANTFPSYGTAAAASWTSIQGIGQVYASATESTTRAFVRGGDWTIGTNGGVFSLHFNDLPGSSNVYFGFRVAK